MSTTVAKGARAWHADSRIAPSIRSRWASLPARPRPPALSTRAAALAHLDAAANDALNALFGSDAWAGGEALATKRGLDISENGFTSSPDGNEVSVCVMKPSAASRRPAVVYFHGGGMAKASCFHGNFQTFGRLLAHHGVVVILVDFRNSLYPAQPGDTVAPFPAGLNDCVSAVRWVDSHRSELGIVESGGIVVAGESGGGNLAIATALRLKQEQKVSGVYAMCPFISGVYIGPDAFPSTREFDGYVLSKEMMATLAAGYGDGIAANPLAWPSNCTSDDLQGFPPIVISTNELDPLRDEGMDFYRKCMAAGVQAEGKILLGTVHATDNYFPGTAPHITHATCGAITGFVKSFCGHGRHNKDDTTSCSGKL